MGTFLIQPIIGLVVIVYIVVVLDYIHKLKVCTTDYDFFIKTPNSLITWVNERLLTHVIKLFGIYILGRSIFYHK